MLQVYKVNGDTQVQMTGRIEPYPINTYTAQTHVRGGVEHVAILHDTLSVFNDVTQEWEGCALYCQWFMFANELNVQWGVDHASTIAALNDPATGPLKTV